MAYGTLKQESASVTPFRDPWLLNGGPLNLGLGPWPLEQGSGKISINQFKIAKVERLLEPNITHFRKAAINAAIIWNTKKPPQI